MSWTKYSICFIGICGTLCTAASAYGAPFAELAGGGDDSAGLNSRLFSENASASYFNPASLTEAEDGLMANVGFFSFDLGIDLQDRPSESLDIPDSIYDARQRTEDGNTTRLERRPLPTDSLPKPRRGRGEQGFKSYLGFGFVHHLIPRLALGFWGQIPTESFFSQRPLYADEREQYFSNSIEFTRYGGRLVTPTFNAAVAGDVFDWLDVGAGVEMVTRARTETEIFLPDATNQSRVFVNADTYIDTSLVPHFAVNAAPLENLKLVSTLHMPYANEVSGQSDIGIWGSESGLGSTSQQSFSFTYDYQPMRAAIGGKYGAPIGKYDLVFGATGRWANWSEYTNRHGEKANWSDTIEGAVTTELSHGGHAGAVSMEFVPSPVPVQRGRTNYVDNDRIAASFGYEWTGEVAKQKIALGGQLQLHRLIPRTHEKTPTAREPVRDEFPTSVDSETNEVIDASKGLQTNNPGYPGYSSSGWMTGAFIHSKLYF